MHVNSLMRDWAAAARLARRAPTKIVLDPMSTPGIYGPAAAPHTAAGGRPATGVWASSPWAEPRGPHVLSGGQSSSGGRTEAEPPPAPAHVRIGLSMLHYC